MIGKRDFAVNQRIVEAEIRNRIFDFTYSWPAGCLRNIAKDFEEYARLKHNCEHITEFMQAEDRVRKGLTSLIKMLEGRGGDEQMSNKEKDPNKQGCGSDDGHEGDVKTTFKTDRAESDAKQQTFDSGAKQSAAESQPSKGL
jgi:hypothetical protein